MAHRHGESAVEELALLIPKLHALTDYDEGVTVNVGLIEGGTSVNTIAPYAYAGIDLRMETIEQAEHLDKLIRAQIAKRANPEITYELESRSGISRPPFVPDEGSKQLLRYVQEVGKNMGGTSKLKKLAEVPTGT
ncbi:peptidase dimerization domain-containing protein [Geomicrobium sp. JCM 19038]|uniref:peptidase dimerization domain-containing protein n=1 Tax=Geomicrobium sp. JCM 19038 TaxID=1460635 RepID=UPI001268BDF2|nr:peptidase dimerization domain-containing protein [Geomicrobium sp. JCM 19038]